MGRRRSAALALACWLFAGCDYAALPAESSPLACINRSDDDGDGRFDCDDPDCWGNALCRIEADAGIPPLGPAIPPSEVPDTTGNPVDPPPDPIPTTDASVPMTTPDAGKPPDGKPDAEVDASVPTSLCGEYCPPGYCDEGGTCQAPLEFGAFDVVSIKLVGPLRNNGACLDYRISGCLSLSTDFACCDPDPMVVVKVGDTKAGFITVADEASYTFEAVDMKLELREGDEVRFDVMDQDNTDVGDITIGEPQLMFSCSTFVDRAMIARGEIGCAPNNDDDSLPEGEYGVAAVITPEDDEDGDQDASGDMP